MARDNPSGEYAGHPVEVSVASALRRFELTGRCLPIPVTPQPGEGLADLFMRACQRNGEPFPTTVWKHVINDSHRRKFNHFSFAFLDEDNAAFSDGLGTPNGSDDIAPLRYHLTRKGRVSFFGTEIFTSQLSRKRRVSPRFLSANRYQKAMWAISSIPFDTTTHEYLLDHCPVCKQELTFRKNLGVCFCHACVADDEPNRPLTDLRNFPQPVVELESYDNIDFACSLIDPELDPGRDDCGRLHSDLRGLNRGQIFEIVVQIARMIDKSPDKLPSNEVSVKALDAACAGVRNWPRGVLELADTVGWFHPCHAKKRGYNLNPIMAALASYQNFLGKDFLDRARSRLRAGIAQDEPCRTRYPMAEAVSIPASLVVDKRGAMIREAVAAGLPRLEMLSLYLQKRVSCADEAIAIFLENDNVECSDFGSQLNAVQTNSLKATMPLYQVVTALSGPRVGWAGVIRGILDGQLPVSIASRIGRTIKRLETNDLEKVKACISQSPYSEWADDVLLPSGEAGFYLGICEASVRQLVRRGMLPPGKQSFQSIRKFREQFICGIELQNFMKLNGHRFKSVQLIGIALAQLGITAEGSQNSLPKVYRRADLTPFFNDRQCKIWPVQAE
ncbi:hypothetical protein [Rhizobium leguminosarum]|uniref:hypothetical protein n=1 Tax=Rhizobium leguminosarum TaxID=384 RepID=UPI0004B5E394|nr:hypothetical protein [Rhizobium leguminosarum]